MTSKNIGDEIDKMLEGQLSDTLLFDPLKKEENLISDIKNNDKSRSLISKNQKKSRSKDRERRRREKRKDSSDLAKVRAERAEKERERDQRTVFAAQIHPKNEEREIFDFFSDVGKVVDIQLIRDTRTYKSKGLAYIEFEDRRSVPHALALSGRNLNGYPVLVQMTQSDRSYASQENNVNVPVEKPKILHVRNLHKKLHEEDIQPIFSAFGEIRSIEIVEKTDANECFIEFIRGVEATQAMVQLNGLEVVGKRIIVSQANKNLSILENQNEKNSGRFEDESGNSGIHMSAQDKQNLMTNLARRAGLTTVLQQPNVSMKPMTTRCVLLKQMFDSSKETDPDFDLEIREDVCEEVGQYGRLVHIYVDKTSKDGRIYLKFGGTDAAEKALRGLNGRWFAQNRIEANFMSEDAYKQMFPGV